MQLFAGDTNALGEQGFDVHMNIFQAYRPVEFAGDDLRADFLQPLDNLIPLGLGQDADLGQHGGVGDGAVDVVVIQAVVKTDGCSKALDKGISRFGEASAPGFDGLLRSEEHTSELQSRENLVCRLLLEKKKPVHT